MPPGAIVSEVWASDGTVTVRATLVDEIRPASAPTLAALHERKIRTMMLTGDREEAAAIASNAAASRVPIPVALAPRPALSIVLAIRAAGFMPLSLGPRILRTETAAAAALAAMQALWGDA